MAYILFISPYYFPEKGAAAVRISQMAESLVQRGHQVTVLTTVPNYPDGIVPPEYRGHLLKEEVRRGVRIIRVWSYITANRGFLRRILAQLSFGFLAPLLGGNAVGHPDVIIVQSPPLFDAIAARIMSFWKHCPFVFMVSDLWPESAVQLGMLRHRTLIWLAERLEWSTYLSAGFVWVVTGGLYSRLIQRGLDPERLFVLTNGADIAKFRPLPQASARAGVGWEHGFTLLYAGNHGLVYGLETVLEAADILQDDPDIHIFFVGNGVKKAELIADARRRNLKNVTFLDAVPHDDIPLLLAAADACLIPLRNIQLVEMALPLKMFEAMACGRPILLAAEGLARQLAVDEAGAALYVEPQNAAELAKAIRYLRAHPEEAELLGLRGRTFVEARFGHDTLAMRLDTRLKLLLRQNAGVPSTNISNPTSIAEERE